MPDSVLRLVSWNVDGLERTLPPPSAAKPSARKSRTLRVALSELHESLGRPDILALQEVRIRSTDSVLISSMEKALPGYVCGHSLCRDALNARFRGGRAYGVATYVREEIAPRWVDPPVWDREGRLVMFELPQLDLFFANVYAVNGTDKPYIDPEHGCKDGDRHAYKRRFQAHMLEIFEAARARGLELVLAGDWNISRAAIDTHPRLRTAAPHQAARAMLNDTFMPALDVEDAFRVLNPNTRAYTWFNRIAAHYGRLDAARVDYLLVSKSLLPAISSLGILQEQPSRFGSDHAPITLILNTASSSTRAG
jgi:exodeoxyribonuclease III